MSPIPSVATPFALSTNPSVAPDPDSVEQSGSMAPQHLLGTGGLLFAVIALVSVAGYFHHARGAANNTGTSNTWASLSSFFSSMRQRGSATTSTAVATDWPVDLEVGPAQHVSMIYAKFFHPTSWDLVECHPATPSAPAICVEDEAREARVSDPKLPGMNLFLDMDGDGDGSRDRHDNPKRAREKPNRGARLRVEELPPYYTSSPINVNFTSEIIGTTVRPKTFLSVPGEHEDDSSEGSSSYSEFDFSCSADDGISTSPPRSSSNTRRYGMAYLSQRAKYTIPEEALVSTISRRTGLFEVSKFLETGPTVSCRPPEWVEPVDDEPTTSNCQIGLHDTCDDLRNSWSDADTPVAPHEGLDVMRRLLAELRDPNSDYNPRAFSEDSDSEYYEDDHEEGRSVPCLTPTCRLGNVRRNSLESTSSTPRIDSDVSEEGPIYPLTPPPKSVSSMVSIPNVHKPRSLPTKAYIRTNTNSLSLLYGPPLPLVASDVP